MRLEIFFNKFDTFADAPNAVERMRELILYFAVTGKLVDKVESVAPVTNLIKSLEKGRDASTHRQKRQEFTDSEFKPPFEIPRHWAWVPLNKIGNLGGGMTPSKSKSSYWDGAINWFSSKDIKTDYIDESSLKITEEGLTATRLQLYNPGCLFIVGRSGILKHTLPVSINRTPGTSNQDLKVLQPFVNGLERYLQIMLKGMNSYIIANLVKTGMTVQSLKYNQFAAHPFPLPPLAEQKRIVAKVDELMALCDRLEAEQQERETRHVALAGASLARFANTPSPQNLQFLFHKSYEISPADLRKSILTLAVQGKLVPQNPKGESAEHLLNEIVKERLSNSGLESTSLLKRNGSIVEPADFHYEIPESWVWCELQEISDYINGKAHEQFVTDKGGFALVNSRCVSNSGRIFKYSSMQLTPLFREDIALVLSDVPDGRALARALIIDANSKYTLNQRIACIRTSNLINSSFLALVLDRNSYLLQYNDGKKQTNLKKIQIVSCPIPLPPLAEQGLIVGKVNELMSIVDALENQLATAHRTAHIILESLVAELTTGLVCLTERPA